MFGCFGLCGDCFSTSPIPLLVKRFYCSFAIQSKERKEKEEEGEKYCSIEKLENSTVTKNIGNIPLASLRSERSQWLTKSPPPIPSKKDPFCKKLFFSIFALSLNFLAIYFFLLANRDFQMFPAKTFFISTFFWSFAILLFLLPFNLGADLKFVKNFTRPYSWTKNFTH